MTGLSGEEGSGDRLVPYALYELIILTRSYPQHFLYGQHAIPSSKLKTKKPNPPLNLFDK